MKARRVGLDGSQRRRIYLFRHGAVDYVDSDGNVVPDSDAVALNEKGQAQATDQERAVLDVIIADVNGDLDGFLDRIQRIQGVAKRLDLPATLRVFQGTFAAEKNGEIHLYWELPSFIAFAEAETAMHNDDEFLAILDEMGTAGQSFGG